MTRREGNQFPSANPYPVSPPEGDLVWHIPQPEKLPRPTYWPVVMALGLTFVFWGPVTTVLLSGVGLILVTLALVGWIGELRDEP